mgnify:CR=1 FL=1
MGAALDVPRFGPVSRRGVAAAAGVLLAEALLVVGYFGATGAAVTSPRYVLYPFVWINLGLLALAAVRVPPAADRHRRLALVVAVGYFLLLAWIAGLVQVSPATLLGLDGGHAHSHAYLQGWQVTMTAPGWGPRIGYVGHGFQAYFVPYRVVGYLGLATLVYATVLRTAAAALSGVVGVASCVGCAFPLVAPAVGGVFGAGATAAITGFSLDLSTAAFILAFALLFHAATRDPTTGAATNA